MPEATEPTEIDISASMSDLELSELIEVADASAKAFHDIEAGRLMDSIAIGTGFDIAMTQQGLLPPTPSLEIETAPPEADLAAPCPIEAATPTDACNLALNDTYATFATYQNDLDPLLTHHQHY